MTTDRSALVRRGLWLNYLTLGYNALEAVVSLAADLVAGSVALLGFGVDSVIELTSSGAAQWRPRAAAGDSAERRAAAAPPAAPTREPVTLRTRVVVEPH